jgi:small-conductance mechanosensitive channel
MKKSSTIAWSLPRTLSVCLRALVIVACFASGPLVSIYFSASAQVPALKTVPPTDVIAFLNQSIQWYQHIQLERQLVTAPEDVNFLTSDQQTADQVIRLSFDFATADADLRAKQKAATASPDQAAIASETNYQSLLTLANKADQQLKDTQDEMDGLKRKVVSASPGERPKIESTIAELQGEIDLDTTRRDALRDMVDFVGGLDSSGGGAGSLRSAIEELRRAVPAAAAPAPSLSTRTSTTAQTAQQPPQQAPQQAPQPDANALFLANLPVRHAEPSGIFGLAQDLLSLDRKMGTLDDTIKLTDALAQSSKSLSASTSNDLRNLAQRGDQLAAQADTSTAAQLAQVKKDLETVTQQFKQSSGIVLPLGKQAILLNLYTHNLTNWRAAIKVQFNSELRDLSGRLLTLAIILAIVLVLAAVWRRLIFRYVPDIRRRYQFLLLRRITLWIVIGIIIAFSFASQLGQLATFAGLITAGVALALQNVILSFAGYFFLIGKYGIRVGDHVHIESVTGQVVDIGLIRIHLMELSSAESDAQPTGRVVAFSNAVVFQPGAAFFRQIPDTNFIWHQITLILAPESNYQEVEKRLMEAVNSVFSKYKDALESQRERVERSLATSTLKTFSPQSRLYLTQTGLEVVIRYPLELEKSSEIDDLITRALLDAIEREPKLKLVGTGVPNLQPMPALPNPTPAK